MDPLSTERLAFCRILEADRHSIQALAKGYCKLQFDLRNDAVETQALIKVWGRSLHDLDAWLILAYTCTGIPGSLERGLLSLFREKRSRSLPAWHRRHYRRSGSRYFIAPLPLNFTGGSLRSESPPPRRPSSPKRPRSAFLLRSFEGR